MRRTLRTFVQIIIYTALMLPGVWQAATGHNVDEATGWIAIALGVSLAITRVMQVPAVDRALSQVGLGSASRRELELPAEDL